MTHMLTREVVLETRAINEEKRTATFVATTERGVPLGTRDGSLEWLRMSGVQTGRFDKNPVVLDSHRQREALAVVGRVNSRRVEGTKLVTDVEFARTSRANDLWELVRTGFLRSVSVGYTPTEWTELAPGQSDGEGEHRVVGPGIVVRKWDLYELSLVALPADEDAVLVRRNLYLGLAERSTTVEPKSIYEQAVSSPTGDAQPKPAPASIHSTGTDLAARAALEEARSRSILARAPKEGPMRSFAEQLVASDLDVDAAHAAIKAEWAKRNAPVGSQEPATATETKTEQWPAGLTDEVLERSFKRSF